MGKQSTSHLSSVIIVIMRPAILSLFLFGTAMAATAPKLFSPDIKKFEEDFGMPIFDSKVEKHAAKNLAEAVKQINTNNVKFAKGESTFEEALYPESILGRKEFQLEKEGRIVTSTRGLGLVHRPEDQPSKEENDAALARIDAEMERQAVPKSYDARKEGLVTSVKNQGDCGSCAAFASTANHETCMLKAGAKMGNLDLSEQYLIDCGYNGNGMAACQGAGPTDYTVWFVTKGQGTSPDEKSMPYLNTNPRKTCPNGIVKTDFGAKVAKYNTVRNVGVARMKALVAKHGSVNIGLKASEPSFDNYKSGVYQGCTTKQQDHSVLVVGYGTDAASGLDYWLVKNSWGPNWGENGYFRLKMGSDECGMESDIATVTTCEKTGGSGPAPGPKPTAAPAPVPTHKPAPNASCDVSKEFGNVLNGVYHTMVEGGKMIKITCKNSVCSIPNPDGKTNACMVLCGNEKCDGRYNGRDDGGDDYYDDYY